MELREQSRAVTKLLNSARMSIWDSGHTPHSNFSVVQSEIGALPFYVRQSLSVPVRDGAGPQFAQALSFSLFTDIRDASCVG
jgi:hypothetical protein